MESPLVGKRVIIVGAAAMVDVSLDASLRKAGARTIAVSPSPEESVSTIQSERPDLVLMAVTPHNLAEAIVAVQTLAQDPALCIVVMVHHVEIDDERQLREAGISAVFRRPFTAGDLIAALEETFRQHCKTTDG